MGKTQEWNSEELRKNCRRHLDRVEGSHREGDRPFPRLLYQSKKEIIQLRPGLFEVFFRVFFLSPTNPVFKCIRDGEFQNASCVLRA